jgi:hypothetical protein
MRPRLVESEFLKVRVRPKLHQRPRTRSGFVGVPWGLLCFVGVCMLCVYVYGIIVRTPILDPDLDCLPDNLRKSRICRDIMNEARKNKKELEPQKGVESVWRAYNEDSLLIKFNSFSG